MSDSTPAPPAPDSGKAPPPIPDHELLHRVGRGAYGEVWLARSVTGAFRAVKIVHRSSFDNERPFRREFEGILKFEPISRRHDSQVDILHVGRTEDCFYYVMELADDQATGGQIHPDNYRPRTLKSDLLFRSRLPFEECVSVGIALTTALEHLHQNGLVHRDIKPSNIIFVNGVAKLADIGLVTGVDTTRSYVGTEGFAAPEGPGTPQADLFSLGKVLYEMSTGKDRQQFPELPTNLRELPGREGLVELNAVIAKACRHDPRDRYPTAAAMRADLELLQSGKSLARLRRVEARLRTATRIGAVVCGLAVFAIAAWLYQAHQTRVVRELSERSLRAEREQTTARRQAEKEASKSKRVAQVLKDTLKGANPSIALGRDTTLLKEILNHTATNLDQTLANEPEVETELCEVIVETYRDLGMFQEMEQMARKELEVARRRLGEDSEPTAGALFWLSQAEASLGQVKDAEATARDALARYRRLSLKGSYSDVVAMCLNQLGLMLWQRSDLAAAESNFTEAIEIARTLPFDSRSFLSTYLDNLGLVLRGEGKFKESEQKLREALLLNRQMVAESPDVMLVLCNLSQVVADQDRLAEAEDLNRQALGLARKLLAKEHPDVAWTAANLAATLRKEGKFAAAEPLQWEALAIRRKLLGNQHPDVAMSLISLGMLLADEGRPAEAEPLYREALSIRQKAFGDEHPATAAAMFNVAVALERAGNPADAEPLCRSALTAQRKLLRADHPDLLDSMDELGKILLDNGRPAEAEALIRQSLAVREKGSPDDVATFISRSLLGTALVDQTNFAAAESLLLSGYEGLKQRRAKLLGARQERLREAIDRIVVFYGKSGHPDRAAEWQQKLAEFHHSVQSAN